MHFELNLSNWFQKARLYIPGKFQVLGVSKGAFVFFVPNLYLLTGDFFSIPHGGASRYQTLSDEVS